MGRLADIVCLVLICINKVTSQDPMTLEAVFSNGDVKGSMTFKQNSPEAEFCVSSSLVDSRMKKWELRTHRVLYDVPDRCNPDRLGPSLYTDNQAESITLFGKDSIEGRSIVLLNEDDEIISCANVERPGDYVTARATLRKGLYGTILFRQHASSPATLTRVTSDLHLGSADAGDLDLNWMVASTHDCSRVCKTYNPKKNDTDDNACDENSQMSCAVGDLSSKLGSVPVGSTKGSRLRTSVDLNLPLSGPNSVVGKTLQIFATGDVKPRACAVISGYVRRSGMAKFDEDGVTGEIMVTQLSPFDPTKTRVCFKNLRSMGDGYHIHKWPVPQRLSADQNVCGASSVSGHFNPFSVVYDDNTPAAGEGTEEMYEVGDLGMKYGLLSGKDDINKMYTDYNLPLFGPNSVLGRAVVLHRAKTDHEDHDDMSMGHGQNMTHTDDMSMGHDNMTMEEESHDDMSHEGHGMSHEGHGMSHEGHDMSHEGHNMSHEGHNMSHEGHGMSHEGHGMSHKGHDRWMCSTLRDMSTLTYALATLKYPVIGHVLLSQREGDEEGDTSVYVWLDYADGSDDVTQGHSLFVHQKPISSDALNTDVSSRCASVGAVFNPSGSTTSGQCSMASPAPCRVGDISSRHGSLSVRAEEGPSRAFFVDQHLSLQGPRSIIGKSIVLTNQDGSSARLACADILRLWPREAYFVDWGLIAFKQNTWIVQEPTTITVNIKPTLKEDTEYHVATKPIREDSDERCSELGGVFNPFNVTVMMTSMMTHDVAVTKEMVPVGDLSGKFGTLNGSYPSQLVLEDPTLDLMGPLSVVGRALKLEYSDPSVKCGNIYERGGMGGMYLSAVAKFTGEVVGEIVMRQFLYQDGTTTHTTVFVDLRKAEGPQTVRHNWHVHVTRVGDDATASTGRCSSTGGHYNPYMVNLQENYNECSPSNPLRCELGDQGSKLGKYDMGSGVLVATDIDLPLIGPFTVVGRSIVVHAENAGAPRIACADILPGPDTAIFLDITIQTPEDIDRSAILGLFSNHLETPSYNIVVDILQNSGEQNIMCTTVRVYFLGLEARKLKEKLQSYLAFSNNAFGQYKPCTKGVSKCSVSRQGIVAAFSGERLSVKQPCNYRLADVTCGQYDVTVIGRHALNDKFLYYPSYFKVKVVSRDNATDMWEGETTVGDLEKCVDDSTQASPWTTLGGATPTSVMVTLDRRGRSTVVSDSSETFKVELRLDDPRRVLSVTCKDLRKSEGYPGSLCQSPLSEKDIISSRRSDLGVKGKSQVILYDVLSDRDLPQTGECESFVDEFQGCKKDTKAIKTCEKIVASCKTLKSLNGDYKTWFSTCLKAYCDNDRKSLRKLKTQGLA